VVFHVSYAHVCSRMLTYAHVCSRMLTYAHVCSRMLTYAQGMLTCAHVCSRMLTYAVAGCCATRCQRWQEEAWSSTCLVKVIAADMLY
jgi:hypothetical protein